MKKIINVFQLRLRLAYQAINQHLYHKPGIVDVSTIEPGQPFMATPNFYFIDCGHPCRLPLFPGPTVGDKSWCVSGDWPCEYRRRHRRKRGPFCFSYGFQPGDKVDVVAQVRGQILTNMIGQQSDIWNVLHVPTKYVTENRQLLPAPVDDYYTVFASDLWLGNTGDHGIGYTSV